MKLTNFTKLAVIVLFWGKIYQIFCIYLALTVSYASLNFQSDFLKIVFSDGFTKLGPCTTLETNYFGYLTPLGEIG